MSANLGNWVNFNLKTGGAFERLDEVEKIARDKIAIGMERNLRTRVDPGISMKSANVAETIRVKTDDNRFVIYSESHAAVLAATSKQMGVGTSDNQATGIEDLFEQSSGVPTAKTRPDGSVGLVFKTISLDNLFREQRENERDQMVEHSVTESMRNGIVDAYDEAFNEVNRRHPSE